jgi:hypothetical protein
MQRETSKVFGETPQRWFADSEQASRSCSMERAIHRSPVEDGARAERSPPVVGVEEPRGVAEPVEARHPRHDGRRQAVVVPQRRGEPRVVARVVPEPLRHYDDTRRASRTRAKRGEEREGGGRNWEDDGRPRGRGSAAGVGGGTKPRRRDEREHVAAVPVRCRGGEWLAVARRAPLEAKPRSEPRTRSLAGSQRGGCTSPFPPPFTMGGTHALVAVGS